MSNTPIPTHPQPQGGRFPVLGCFFAVSLFVNLAFAAVIFILCLGLLVSSGGDTSGSAPLPEKHFLGSKTAADKVAIITLDGVIMEGLLDYADKQFEQAGKDTSVKATVLRINSPGGSITASEALYQRILRLKDGDADKEIHARPIVVSMGSIAASGGYYIAAPAAKIFAERTTQTGSIGVYASFPNVQGLAANYGVTMNTIRAGDIKDAGSLFRDLSPVERQVLQDMVDDAYVQFLEVVEKGRPALTRAKMLERFPVKPLRPDPKVKSAPPAEYTRYRADGGVFSAAKAKDLDLVDDIGTLEDAVKAAAGLANVSSYRAVRYQRQKSLSDIILGVRSPVSPPDAVAPRLLREALTPRMWYLAPGHEAAAFAAAEAKP